MTTAEIVYLGHDNSIDLILRSDGSAVDLTSATRVTLAIGPVCVSSANGADDPIRWAQPGYGTGEIRLTLGGIACAPGSYRATLVVYDLTNTNGIVWGKVPLRIVSGP